MRLNRWRTALRDGRPARRAAEGGFTLIELMVSIILLAVVSTSFLAATNSIFGGIHKEQGVVNAVDGNRRALQSFDKQVRTASAINTPALAADGNYYVEYLWTKTSTTNVDVQTCTQWRLNPTTDVLQSRSWTSGTVPATRPTFTTIDTGVVNNPAVNPPFSLLPPYPVDSSGAQIKGVVLQFQELKINLIAQQDKGSVTSTETLTALNSSSAAALATPVCQEVSRSS
jgi:prepilin-type N-terminal cleavage/methylation domain-containing protein